MSDAGKKSPNSSWLASLSAWFAGAKPKEQTKAETPGPMIVDEIRVNGFDPEAEPVIKKWSNGTIWIHFEAMPPFFAEEQGNEADFADFEQQIEKALTVPVTRLDREIFAIKAPLHDTVEKAMEWLGAFHKRL